METNKKERGIYEKIQAVRVELNKRNIKKSGKHAYSKFNYFELADFLPDLNQLVYEHRFTTTISFEPSVVSADGVMAAGTATITAIDWDSDVRASVSCPLVNADMKGTQAIQNLGATQTYLRRYLYMLMFDIAESDVVNELLGDDNAGKADTQQKTEPQQRQASSKNITEAQIRALKALGLTDNNMIELVTYCKVERIEDIPYDKAVAQIKKLEAKKGK